MKKRKQKWLTAGISMIAAMALMVGCGADTNQGGNEAAGTEKADTAAAESESTQETSENGQERYTVRFGSSAGEDGHLLGIPGVAWEKGLIQEELDAAGYDVEVFGFANGVAVNEGFLAESIDLSTLGNVPAANGFANQIGTEWLAVGLSTYNYTLVVGKDSGITSPAELEGKKVGYGLGTAAQYFFEGVVKEFGLDESKIQSINLSGVDAETALAVGQVDAIVNSEHRGYIQEQNGTGTILLNTKDFPEYASLDTFVGRTKFLEEHPDAAVAVLKAFIRAWDEFKTDDDPDYLALSGMQLEGHEDLGPVVFNPDNGEFKNLDPMLYPEVIEREQGLADFLYSVDKLSNQVDISKFVNTSYYETALEELGKK